MDTEARRWAGQTLGSVVEDAEEAAEGHVEGRVQLEAGRPAHQPVDGGADRCAACSRQAPVHEPQKLRSQAGEAGGREGGMFTRGESGA